MKKSKNGFIIENKDFSNIITIYDKTTKEVIKQQEFEDAVIARYFFNQL
jgi:hypothetical protein